MYSPFIIILWYSFAGYWQLLWNWVEIYNTCLTPIIDWIQTLSLRCIENRVRTMSKIKISSTKLVRRWDFFWLGGLFMGSPDERVLPFSWRTLRKSCFHEFIKNHSQIFEQEEPVTRRPRAWSWAFEKTCEAKLKILKIIARLSKYPNI